MHSSGSQPGSKGNHRKGNSAASGNSRFKRRVNNSKGRSRSDRPDWQPKDRRGAEQAFPPVAEDAPVQAGPVPVAMTVAAADRGLTTAAVHAAASAEDSAAIAATTVAMTVVADSARTAEGSGATSATIAMMTAVGSAVTGATIAMMTAVGSAVRSRNDRNDDRGGFPRWSRWR